MRRATLCLGLGLIIGLPVAALADDTIAVDELEVIAPENAEDMPMGQTKGSDEVVLPNEGDLVDQGIFGLQGGYIHPYLQIGESYSDNIFNVDKDTTSSWITHISPGIWISLPRTIEVPISLASNNTSPGGLAHQVGDSEGGEKFQLYGLAGADFSMYSDDSDYNTQDYFFEGLGRYNMPSGLSLQIVDRYSRGHDIFETTAGSSEDNIREYDSNLLMLTADWDMTEKLRFKVDYSNFDLNYDDNINDFLNRQDNLVDLYGYYKYSVKTAFFLQYRYTDVDYDSASENDNDQNSYFAGINYKSTDKLALNFKIGVQDKEFDNPEPGVKDPGASLAMDMMAIYQITEKTQITLDLYRNNEESNSQDASSSEVLGVNLGYEQQITEKIIATISAGYYNTDYEQLPGYPSREDDTYSIRPAVQYLFRDWMSADLGYSYEKTDSSDNDFDYETNIFFVSLNFAI